MALFAEPMYEVSFQVRLFPNKLQSNSCLFDTGPGLNIINSYCIKDDWKHEIKCHPTARLQSANNKTTTLLGTVLLIVRIENFLVKVWFRIIENSAADILFGTPFIDRYIRGIFPGNRKLYRLTLAQYPSFPTQQQFGNEPYHSLSRLKAELCTTK